jgi:hypothetical protein
MAAFFACSGSVRFFAGVPQPPPLSGLSRPELEALLVELFGKVGELERLWANSAKRSPG